MLRFLEDRLGIGTALRNSRRHAHAPQGIGYLHSIGFAALTVLVLQVISGVAMAFHYVPTTGSEHSPPRPDLRRLRRYPAVGARLRATCMYRIQRCMVQAA